jgi:hypothetical protein
MAATVLLVWVECAVIDGLEQLFFWSASLSPTSFALSRLFGGASKSYGKLLSIISLLCYPLVIFEHKLSQRLKIALEKQALTLAQTWARYSST